MSEEEWHKFCDDVEEAVEPANRTLRAFLALVSCTLLVFCVTGFGSSIYFSDPQHAKSESQGKENVALLLWFVLPLAMLTIDGLTVLILSFRDSRAHLELRRICEETSTQLPQLKFRTSGQLRNERNRTDGHDRRSDDGCCNSRHLLPSLLYRAGGDYRYVEVSVKWGVRSLEGVTVPLLDTILEYEPPRPPSPEHAVAEYLASAHVLPGPAERLEILENARKFLSEKEYDQKRTEILSSI